MDLSNLWGILTIVGPIVLAVAIAWAMFHNRGTPAEVARTEEATHRMYDEQNREDEARDAR